MIALHRERRIVPDYLKTISNTANNTRSETSSSTCDPLLLLDATVTNRPKILVGVKLPERESIVGSLGICRGAQARWTAPFSNPTLELETLVNE